MHKAADSNARHVWFSPSGSALKWAVQVHMLGDVLGWPACRIQLVCILLTAAPARAACLCFHTSRKGVSSASQLQRVGPGSAPGAPPPDKNRERSVAVKHIAEVASGARLFPSQNSKGAPHITQCRIAAAGHVVQPVHREWPVVTAQGWLVVSRMFESRFGAHTQC